MAHFDRIKERFDIDGRAGEAKAIKALVESRDITYEQFDAFMAEAGESRVNAENAQTLLAMLGDWQPSAAPAPVATAVAEPPAPVSSNGSKPEPQAEQTGKYKAGLYEVFIDDDKCASIECPKQSEKIKGVFEAAVGGVRKYANLTLSRWLHLTAMRCPRCQTIREPEPLVRPASFADSKDENERRWHKRHRESVICPKCADRENVKINCRPHTKDQAGRPLQRTKIRPRFWFNAAEVERLHALLNEDETADPVFVKTTYNIKGVVSEKEELVRHNRVRRVIEWTDTKGIKHEHALRDIVTIRGPYSDVTDKFVGRELDTREMERRARLAELTREQGEWADKLGHHDQKVRESAAFNVQRLNKAIQKISQE